MLGFLKNSGIYFDTNPKEGSNNAVTSDGIFKAIQAGGGGGGTSDYTLLTNKPKINNVELSGNKSLASLGIASRTELSTVEDNITDINADIIELENNKANVSDIPDISGLATKLELQSTNDRMTQAETDIDTLETAVVEKATTASVTALDGRVTQAETDIDSIETLIPSNATALNKLATMSDISASNVGIVVSWSTSGAIPYDDYLQCDGSSFDVDEYPELATLFPSGVLPEIADHSRGLGSFVNYSNIISTTNHTMEHDGVMFVKSTSRKSQNVYLNNQIIGGYLSESDYPVDGYSLSFCKGDLIRISNAENLVVWVRFYDKYKYIKVK